MKILFILLALGILNKECDQKQIANTPKNTINPEKSSTVNQEDITVSYEATTRGYYEKIWVTKDSLIVTNDRDNVKKISNVTPVSEWNELMELLKTVDINELPNLEAPTSMRHYDGAAIATLGITQNKLEIKSNSFDHGHPPKVIELLVNKVLSMKEMYEKN